MHQTKNKDLGCFAGRLEIGSRSPQLRDLSQDWKIPCGWWDQSTPSGPAA